MDSDSNLESCFPHTPRWWSPVLFLISHPGFLRRARQSQEFLKFSACPRSFLLVKRMWSRLHIHGSGVDRYRGGAVPGLVPAGFWCRFCGAEPAWPDETPSRPWSPSRFLGSLDENTLGLSASAKMPHPNNIRMLQRADWREGTTNQPAGSCANA
jgi:hypothetical protein